MERLTYKEKETVHWSTFRHSHIKYAFSCGRSTYRTCKVRVKKRACLRSLINRHLTVAKMFLDHVQPRCLRETVQVQVLRWPLTEGLTLHGRDIVCKFKDAFSTRNGGRSVSVRSGSRSQNQKRTRAKTKLAPRAILN